MGAGETSSTIICILHTRRIICAAFCSGRYKISMLCDDHYRFFHHRQHQPSRIASVVAVVYCCLFHAGISLLLLLLYGVPIVTSANGTQWRIWMTGEGGMEYIHSMPIRMYNYLLLMVLLWLNATVWLGETQPTVARSCSDCCIWKYGGRTVSCSWDNIL